jgi:epoxide hydrolase-like predicted phosphatase
MLHAVVFDIGGVLELTPPTGFRERWEQALGLGTGELDERMYEVWRGGTLGTLTLDQVHEAFGRELGISPHEVERFMADFWDDYLGTPNTELIDYFRGLRSRIRTGILSNSFVGAREKERARYGFEDMTDVLVYSHESGTAKADPAIYRLVCERLDVQPRNAVFVDDHERAVDGARAIGMTGLLFQDNAQVIADLEALLAHQDSVDARSTHADRLP